MGLLDVATFLPEINDEDCEALFPCLLSENLIKAASKPLDENNLTDKTRISNLVPSRSCGGHMHGT